MLLGQTFSSTLFLPIFCIHFIIFEILNVNSSFHPGLTFQYEGPTWSSPPKHVMEETKLGKVIKWDELRVKTIIIKNPKVKEFSAAYWLDESDWTYVEEVFKKTIHITKQMILGVRQLKSPITVPRRCKTANGEITGRTTECFLSEGQSCSREAYCYDLDLPEKYAGMCKIGNSVAYHDSPGIVDADLVVFISVSNNIKALANAIPCQYEYDFGRPLAGRIIISYDVVKKRKPMNQLKNILLHELFHIILYPMAGRTFKNPHDNYKNYTDPYIFERRKWKSAVREYERSAVLLTLPTVTAYVQKYFNCPNLKGAELVNLSTTLNTNMYNFAHWDNRLFPDALMAPMYLRGNQLSKLDVALAIDSGWYKINQSVGRELSLMKGKGCHFVTKSCFDYMEQMKYDPEDMYPYCQRSKKYKWMCSLDHGQAVQCDGGDKSEDVHWAYQLHNGLYYSGEFFQYCPMVIAPNYLIEDASPLCRDDNVPELIQLGAAGGEPSSMCMKFLNINARKTKIQCPKLKRSYFGVCVRRNCTDDGFLFTFGGRSYFCPKNYKEKIVKVQTITTVPYGCKVSFTFCCPSYDVCSHNLIYNSSLMELGQCTGIRFKYNWFILFITVSISLLNFF